MQFSQSTGTSRAGIEEVPHLADAAALLLSSVLGEDLSTACAEEKLASLPQAAAALFAAAQEDVVPSRDSKWIPMLTPRPKEILRMLCSGKTPKEIREELIIEESTLRSHLQAIRKAFGTHTYRDAVNEARRMGLD